MESKPVKDDCSTISSRRKCRRSCIDAGKRSSLPEENVTVVIGLTSPKRLKEKIKPKEISPKSNWQQQQPPRFVQHFWSLMTMNDFAVHGIANPSLESDVLTFGGLSLQ
ncbi:hypothetical protein OUZ56_020771 [Daphnia magna]|uniref:Uncharacterized protein n=1 Tax=Daphnia magna TaxID=35525 RepID=A0ABQ9ZFF1_9CRUS|nr:hypothetical protein OUZ56_020771 [Daphnia magna]